MSESKRKIYKPLSLYSFYPQLLYLQIWTTFSKMIRTDTWTGVNPHLFPVRIRTEGGRGQYNRLVNLRELALKKSH
jgi:hypothetical protein